MTDIETIARAVLDGADRNDEAKVLARWVLERVAEDRDFGPWVEVRRAPMLPKPGGVPL